MHHPDHIRPPLMNRTVNHIPRRVRTVHIPTLPILHHAFLIHQDQILGSHQAEALAVRVDPETVRADGVADRHVAAGAFVVVAVHAEPAEGDGVVEFAEVALGGEGAEDGEADVVEAGGLGGEGGGAVGAVGEGEGGGVECLCYLGDAGVGWAGGGGGGGGRGWCLRGFGCRLCC